MHISVRIKWFVSLLFFLSLLAPPPVVAQQYVKLLDSTGNPITNSNPLPTGSSGSSSTAITATVNPTGTTLANSTSVNVALTGLAQSQALIAASSNVTISVPPTAAGTYISFSGTATTSKYYLPPGWSYTYTGLPAISTVYFLGAGATGNISIISH